MADRDYIIDIPGLEKSTGRLASSCGARDPRPRSARPWLSIYWKCCRTYSRIYRNRAGDAYVGACPKCGAKVRAGIGADGVSTRFFTAE